MKPAANDVKVFVPAKEFQTSLAFYRELGWQLNWEDGSGLAELQLADSRFFLQDYYQKDWAENFMMHITVDDADAWYQHVTEVLDGGEFGAAKVSKPKLEPYGALVCHVWDPCGVLLHFAQMKP